MIVGLASERTKRIVQHRCLAIMRRGDLLMNRNQLGAELTECACSAIPAASISFMNEISRLCDKVGASAQSLKRSGLPLPSGKN